MKLISKLLVAITVLLSFTVCNAQIKNSVTETVKVSGNCGMCKTTIEKVGNLKNTAKVDWNANTQMATLTYDSKKTSQDEILKRIALSGYDSEKFLAPDDVYNNLHGCCQYERVSKVAVKEENKTTASNEDHSNHANHSEMTTTAIQNENQLKAVFENYFLVKDALVTSDGTKTAAAAQEFLTAINNVNMDKLEMDVHVVWMKVVEALKDDAKNIADNKDVKQQRDQFIRLSKDIYSLIKVSKYETPVYYQFCPMANDGKGANWLSKENAIKNPYYGSMMLSCGKTVETIK
jgi:copper chaperone CopZ